MAWCMVAARNGTRTETACCCAKMIMSLCNKIEMSLLGSYTLPLKGGRDGSSQGEDHDECRGVTEGTHSKAGNRQSHHAEEGSGADGSVIPADEEAGEESTGGGREGDRPSVEGEEREQEDRGGGEAEGTRASSEEVRRLWAHPGE